MLHQPRIANPSQSEQGTIKIINSQQAVVLNQNVPNPFREQTEISFFIPEQHRNAVIHFYDNQGKILNSYTINQSGNGKITVYGDDLSSGIYTYALVIDGEVMLTRKMVKE